VEIETLRRLWGNESKPSMAIYITTSKCILTVYLASVLLAPHAWLLALNGVLGLADTTWQYYGIRHKFR